MRRRLTFEEQTGSARDTIRDSFLGRSRVQWSLILPRLAVSPWLIGFIGLSSVAVILTDGSMTALASVTALIAGWSSAWSP